jgi:hypothetical protein
MGHTAVDLMAPNLNKEKVQVKAQMLRQMAKQESQSVQARDKAALEKQRYVASIRVIRSCWGAGSDNVLEADDTSLVWCGTIGRTRRKPRRTSRKRLRSKNAERRINLLAVGYEKRLSGDPMSDEL